MRSLPFIKIRTYVFIFTLLLFAGLTGYTLSERRTRKYVTSDTNIILNTEAPEELDVDFSLFWEVWKNLFRYHIDAAHFSVQNMVYGAIRGMVESTDDPYTVFLSPDENKDFKQDMGGSFEGIGVQLGLKDGHIIVIAPLKGDPAEKVGIRAGDWIVKVDEEDTIGWTLQEAVKKIRGPKGTTVVLTILHETGEATEDISIIREAIHVPFVKSWVKVPEEIIEISGVNGIEPLRKRFEKVAYIELSRFGDSTNSEWDKTVREIVQAQNINGSLKGLILDLRSNPGGYLDGSVYIASEFLQFGIVVSQVGTDGQKEDYPVNRKGMLFDIPLVVLVDKGTASASEIVAGALQDHKRAMVVGEKTFGKGYVQSPQEFKDGSALHVTTAKWLLPSGKSINKEGVTPDTLIEMETYEATRDAQLAKAIEILFTRD